MKIVGTVPDSATLIALHCVVHEVAGFGQAAAPALFRLFRQVTAIVVATPDWPLVFFPLTETGLPLHVPPTALALYRHASWTAAAASGRSCAPASAAASDAAWSWRWLT